MSKEKYTHYLSLKWELVRTIVPLLVMGTILMQVAVYIIARQSGGSICCFQINELVQNTKEKSDILQEGTKDLRKASEDLGAHMEKFTL